MEAVHDGLRRLDGVARVEIDLQQNLVTITPFSDRVLDLAAVPRAIARAGFRPGEMRVRGRGVLEAGAEGARLRFAHWPIAYPWTGQAPPVDPAPFEARVEPGEKEIVLRLAL